VITAHAPGRVNLIGEHTDYNDGFALSAALACHSRVTVSVRRDRTVTVHARDFRTVVTFDLDRLSSGRAGHWSDNLRGVLVEMQRAGYKLVGLDTTVWSDVPIGAGLSSSASVETAFALALLGSIDAVANANALPCLLQRAEQAHAGTNCGILDQFISLNARQGYAKLLDARSLANKDVPLNPEVQFIACDSGVKRSLTSSQYNDRRAECEAAIKCLRTVFPKILALRDLTTRQLEDGEPSMDGTLYRRARHVVSENERVLAAAAALRRGDFAEFGACMNDSHRSLRDDYQVSCPELDMLVELACGAQDVYGARLTGAGFGGCTVSLVGRNSIEAFQRYLAKAYFDETGRRATFYHGAGASGARIV